MPSEQDKRDKYRTGRYMFPPPPVQHARWSEGDWIRYIDINGRWLSDE